MKLTSVIKMDKGMCPVEKAINSTNILDVSLHKISEALQTMVGKILKRFFVDLYRIPYNETKISHSVIKKSYFLQKIA